MDTAKKRWLSLYVENDVGVLAKISGLFSGKSYNLLSLTVGETEDPTVSRMTISMVGDDKTFEQVKKQLNRSVEVIKVLDFTDLPIHKKEILFIKLRALKREEMEDVFRSAAVFGVAAVKKSGEKTSGDTHSVIRINEHRFLMALSDGMGSGEYAHKVSDTAISLIEAFYRAEMPEGTVLDTINKLLAFSRDERFACIDICSVDLNTGGAEFVKIGSPVAVILRDGKVRVLESGSLPMGILDTLRPAVAQEKLSDGDMLVFMSDGITSAFGSTPELIEFLQPLKPLNPQNLADKLLAAALERTGGKAEDDMTVLCTRIFQTAAAAEDKDLAAV